MLFFYLVSRLGGGGRGEDRSERRLGAPPSTLFLQVSNMQNAEVERRERAIVAECRRRGIPFRVTSRYRSETKQRELYDAWIAGGRKGLPVGRPGLSTHQYGIAFDAVFPDKDRATVVKIAQDYGMVWFGEKDKVHFDIFGPNAWNALLRSVGAI